LSDFDILSEDSSSSKEDEKIKCKKDDFIGLCLMDKSSQNYSNSDSDVSDDLSFESLSSKVVKLENTLYNQDKLLCKVFYENKKLNLQLENFFAEIVSLRSMHDDMSAKPCENYNIIMVNYVDCRLCTLKMQVNLRVPNWNSKSSKLVPYCWVLVWNVLSLNLSWTLIPTRLKILR
jgi:hypothetical protein